MRISALAGAVLAAAASVPASAAPADVALLKSYLGNWSGRGVFQAETPETVVCKLSLTEGNSDKVNYSGRCAVAGTNLSIKGTMAYIEASRRYEAVMTSNAKFSGTAVGAEAEWRRCLQPCASRARTTPARRCSLPPPWRSPMASSASTSTSQITRPGAVYKANVPFSK